MSRSSLVLVLPPFLVVVVLGLVVLGSGCGANGPEAPRGSPVLLDVYWKASSITKVWSRDADAAAPSGLPGQVTQIDFVFDRRLDGNRIEDTVNGVAVPKANPPITVSWPDTATVMSVPPFEAEVRYNSIPQYGGQTGLVFLRPRAVGLPSATTVTFSLDRMNLTSAYGEPMDGPDAIEVSVGPLTVEARPSAPADALVPVSPTYAFRVSFNNRPGPTAALAPYTRVTTGGVPIPFSLAGDASDPTAIYVSPPVCLGAWPSGALIEVAFEPGLPDAFGVPTTIAQTAGSFLVGGTPSTPPDAGCEAPPPTAGDGG